MAHQLVWLASLIQLVLCFPRNVTLGQFPYVVFIVEGANGTISDSKGCTGTILSPSWVLLGAHCLGRSALHNVTLIAGVAGGSEEERGKQMRRASEVAVHPDLSGGADPVDPYPDLALIRTERPFRLGSLVQPVPVHLGPLESASGSCTVVGWGFKETPTGRNYSHQLKWAPVLQMMAYPQCRSLGLLEHSTQFCTKIPARDYTLKGYCGNPLLCGGSVYGIRYLRTYYRLSQYRIDIFVDISYFVPWLRRYVKDLKIVNTTPKFEDSRSSQGLLSPRRGLWIVLSTLCLFLWLRM